MKISELEKKEIIDVLVKAYNNQATFQNKGDIQNANRIGSNIVGVVKTLEILNIKDEILSEVKRVNDGVLVK